MASTDWLQAAVNLNSGVYSYKPVYTQETPHSAKPDDEPESYESDSSHALKQELESTISLDDAGHIVTPSALSVSSLASPAPVGQLGHTTHSPGEQGFSTPVLPSANFFDDAPATSTMEVLPDGRLVDQDP